MRDILAPYLISVDKLIVDCAQANDPVDFALRGVLTIAMTMTDTVRLASGDPAILVHPELGPELKQRLIALRGILTRGRTGPIALGLASAAYGVLMRPALSQPATAALIGPELLAAAHRVLQGTEQTDPARPNAPLTPPPPRSAP